MSAPVDRPSSNNDGKEGDGGDLAQSLDRLTISTSPPAKTPRSPRSVRPAGPAPLKTATDRSPSFPSPGNAVRSPLRSSSSASVLHPSQSATPTLLRKASLNSLHSANTVTPSRRASSGSILPPSRIRSGRSPLRSVSPELPEIVIPTPHSIATDHFKAELDIHHGPEPTRRAETVVILQDACYGHRYSRPRASRAQLSTIVERPERIKACVLGLSAAYVRLGERHQDGAFPLHPDTDAASLPSIPFRIQKSARRLPLGSQTVTNVHGTKWMEELKMMCETAEAKLVGGGKELQRPDIDRGANAEAPRKFHEGDLYLCSESLEAIEGALGGVCDAVDAVFQPQGPRRAFVAIRPPGHHCSASHPSGFCWVNNVHVGIMHGVLSHGLTHAAIIDFDLHHGDGSQAIAWQHNARGVGLAKNAAWWKKTSIGYFSLHDINSYPCEMGDEEKVRNASVCIDGAHGQSIWNVHLQGWKTEADFWALYESKYAVLLEKTRAYLKSHTERLRASGLNSRAAIFLSAGFDASEYEDPGMQRHNVNVPTEFYARFTRDVVRLAAEEGTSVEGRIISVLEGGYSDRALCSGVFSHLCGLAGDGPSNRDQELGSGASETGQQQFTQQRARKDSSASERGVRRYESSWWSPAQLEQLEATLAAPVPAPRVIRNTPPPTYSSPTQASQAKAVNPKNRSGSGLSQTTSNGASRVSFQLPPPPEVPWTIATVQLSRLLIPSGRQTASCTVEELSAEATRIRRERQAALAGSAPPTASSAPEDRPPTRMGLRERKPKPPPVDDDVDRKTRRKTVAGPAVLDTEAGSRGATSVPGKQSRPSRRLSAASTAVSSESSEVPPSVPRIVPIRSSSKQEVVNNSEASSDVAGPGASSNLQVKKTKAPTKKEAVPRAPKGKKSTGPTNGAPAQTTPSANVTAASSADKAGDGVDKLAGEMKKIKITVVTKAQKEARERERLAREKLSQAKTIPGPPPAAGDGSPSQSTPGAADTTTTTTNGNSNSNSNNNNSYLTSETEHQLPSPTPSPAPQAPQIQTPVNPSMPPAEEDRNIATTPSLASPPPTDPRHVPLPASSPPPAPTETPVKTHATPPHVSEDSFVHYQPEGPTPGPPPQSAAEGPQQQNQQLQWLPPNVSATPAPSPIKKKDLPVFSSTGFIPFAPRPGTHSDGSGAADTGVGGA
ncbi:Arginase/deacetylase [Thermothelomyces heterothallicus CBS 203.75]